MTPPIHVGLAQHPIKTDRGRGLSQYGFLFILGSLWCLDVLKSLAWM